jgi:SNF2 family DNA or RNA helicase
MRPDTGSLLWHQLQAIHWILGKYTCPKSSNDVTLEGGLIIGDAPGLGKTLIVLGLLAWISNWDWRQTSDAGETLLQGMASLHDAGGPIFMVIPVAVLQQWKSEAERWLKPGSFEFFLYPANKRERPVWWAQWKESSTPMAKRVLLISYALLRMDYCQKFDSKSADPANGVLAQPKEMLQDDASLYDLVPWMIIVDEAHCARNIATDTFRSIHHVVKAARCCILLTATPIHNKLEDMPNLLILGVMRTTPTLTAIARHIRQQIPIYRARASQHRRLMENHETDVEGGVDDMPSYEDMVQVNGNMIDKLGFGKEFLTQMVHVMRCVVAPYYIGRAHDSLDWEGQPLLRLPPKTTILRHVQLSHQEQEWYSLEKESARPAQKAGKITSVSHFVNQSAFIYFVSVFSLSSSAWPCSHCICSHHVKGAKRLDRLRCSQRHQRCMYQATIAA